MLTVSRGVKRRSSSSPPCAPTRYGKHCWPGIHVFQVVPCLSNRKYHAVCMGGGCVDLIKLYAAVRHHPPRYGKQCRPAPPAFQLVRAKHHEVCMGDGCVDLITLCAPSRVDTSASWQTGAEPTLPSRVPKQAWLSLATRPHSAATGGRGVLLWNGRTPRKWWLAAKVRTE